MSHVLMGGMTKTGSLCLSSKTRREVGWKKTYSLFLTNVAWNFYKVTSIFWWDLHSAGNKKVTPPLHVKTKIVTNDVEVSEFLVQLSPIHTHDPGFNPGFSFDSMSS